MTTKEQIQSIDIYQINGTVNYYSNKNNDEIATPSLDPTLCHSRFFHKKQKQCFGENQIDINSQFEELKPRSLSSPPPPPSLSLTDDSNETNSLTKVKDISKKVLAQPRPSLPTIYSEYQRTKSQSVKLTHLDGNGLYPKKMVRFADDFGLDLSQMKMINTDELPYVPNTAFKHLNINKDQNSFNSERMKVIIYMEPQFENPIHTSVFNDYISRNKIVLEQANAIDNQIYGTIKLISLGLHKRIKIRLTTNNWISFKDYDATYITNSYDGIYDRFSFKLEIDRHRICVGNNIQFCICYESFGGSEYWDNNNQQNYRFNCISRTIPDYSI